jgi:hypothetical protein
MHFIRESYATISSEKMDFEFSSAVDEDLASYEVIWNKLGEFREGIREFETEEWIIFRAKPFRFEEFLLLWDEKLREDTTSSEFITHVLQDIQDYKVS